MSKQTSLTDHEHRLFIAKMYEELRKKLLEDLDNYACENDVNFHKLVKITAAHILNSGTQLLACSMKYDLDMRNDKSIHYTEQDKIIMENLSRLLDLCNSLWRYNKERPNGIKDLEQTVNKVRSFYKSTSN